MAASSISVLFLPISCQQRQQPPLVGTSHFTISLLISCTYPKTETTWYPPSTLALHYRDNPTGSLNKPSCDSKPSRAGPMTQNHIGPRPWWGHFYILVELLLRVPVTHAAVLVWLLALPISGVAASEICYYPDGSVAGPWTYEPCTVNGTAEGMSVCHLYIRLNICQEDLKGNLMSTIGSTFSSCCIPSEGDTCLTDGLCFFPQSTSTQTSGNYVYRGACTDQAWKDGSCATQCITSKCTLLCLSSQQRAR